MRASVLDDGLVARREALYVTARSHIVDDPVFASELQQHGNRDMTRDASQVHIELEALDQESCRGLAQRQRIIGDELLPARGGREQGRIIQWNGKQLGG